jgi:capsular polysaccharide biosynthesis protein
MSAYDSSLFFERPLTIRSLVGTGGVDRISADSLIELNHIGGSTTYDVPPSPLSILDTCDDPQLAHRLFTDPASFVGAPIYIATMDNCLVTPTGAVIMQDGSLILESLYSYSKDNFLIGFGSDIVSGEDGLFLKGGRKITHLPGSTIYNRDVGEYGYFHWVNSILPRFSVVPEIAGHASVRYLISHKTGFAKSSLPLFGIQSEQLTPLLGDFHHCERLHFLSPWVIAGNHWTRPPEIMDVYAAFKTAIGVSDSYCDDAIYLSRGDAPVRRLVNEGAAVTMLQKHCCKSVATTGMSFAAQAQLFHRAKLCVSVHGAGLSNLVFMQPGTAVVEIISPDRLWPTFRSLATRMKLRYAAISGSRVAALAPEARGSIDAGNQDFAVSLEDLDFICAMISK